MEPLLKYKEEVINMILYAHNEYYVGPYQNSYLSRRTKKVSLLMSQNSFLRRS